MNVLARRHSALESQRQDILARLRDRLENLDDLRGEAAALRAELVAIDELLAQIEVEMKELRQELGTDPPPERSRAIEDRLGQLTRAAKEAVARVDDESLESRIEVHEIEVGLATDAALKLRERAQRFLGDPPPEDES